MEQVRNEGLRSPPPPPQEMKVGNVQAEVNVKLCKPLIVGYMSVDVLREYHRDLSQLKYLTYIPEGQLHLDLNHNIDKAVKRTTDDNDEKITLMLKFMLDQKERVKPHIADDMIFICYRRSLISVMCSIFTGTPVTIVGSLYQNRIYLCTIESEQEIFRRKSCKEQDKYCAWGYKFEQYMLSDLPSSLPDIKKPVLENEEFSMYFATELGDHKLFYGAQVDAMLTTRGPIKHMPDPDDVDANITFLRKNFFLELKTNKNISHKVQLSTFRKYKLLRCWCQCYLGGLNGLLVGYRNDDGIIQRVEWFDTTQIVKFCRGKWSPQVSLNLLNRFLNYVKDSFKTMKLLHGEDWGNTKPLTLKFDIDERQRFSVVKTDDKEYEILPNWFTEKMRDEE